jgi:hypothetical protein
VSALLVSVSEDLASLLGPDEKIIWQGKPYSGLLLRGKSVPSLWFGWFFFVVASYGALNVWLKEDNPASFTAIFGVPFVVLGFHMAVSQYLWDAFVRRHTWYSLTNKRAIIATKLFGSGNLKSYPILKETVLEIDQTAGGSLWFATTIRTDADGDKFTAHFGFVGIEHPREVFSLMRKVQTGD